MVRERKPIKALFIFTPTGMGADTWLQLLILRHISEQGVEVHAAVERFGPDGEPTAIYEAICAMPHVRVIPTRFGQSLDGKSRLEKLATIPDYIRALGSLTDLVRYIRAHGIEVLHSTDRPRDATACALLGLVSGATSVVHVHVKYADWVSRGVRWAYRRATAVVGVSQFVAESLVNGGFGAHKVHAILNAIDVSAWDPTIDPAEARAAIGFPLHVPLVVCVARVYSAKGQTELLKALALLKEELPDAHVAIVGADYPPGGGHTEELRSLAASLGVASRVLFTGQRADIDRLLAAADVFCMPSIEEPFGLVFAEAMAMARPVVAIGDGGTAEVVEHGVTGLLSGAHQTAELAQNLLRLLRDPELRARMGERGRADALARFNPQRLARDVRSLYDRVLAP